MASKRDLVEASAFSRRRLVTAFVSGAPGGREVEPVRPARALVGGLALSVLLVAGALIAGVFSPRVAADWRNPGLIVSKEKGAPYVITESADPLVVHPVLNNTSALLIAGDAAREPTVVPQEVIDQQVIGEDLGIVGAPATVPSAALLIPSGWTACTSDGAGTQLTLAAQRQVTAAPDGALVLRDRVSGDHYLIAQEAPLGDGAASARRYLFPTDGAARDKMLSTLGLPVGAQAAEVSPQWLALFPPGGPLTWDSATVPGAGRPVSYPSAVYPGARVGDLVRAGDRPFVLLAEGPAPLDEFAAAVYANLAPPHTPRIMTMAGLPDVQFAPPAFTAARWPAADLRPVVGEACGELVSAPGAAPYVALAEGPTERAAAAQVPAERISVGVDPGRGAYVLSGAWDRSSGGSAFLIDAKGRAYPLVGDDTPALLGYAGYEPPVVPDSWVELFAPGVNLSQEAALCPPAPEGGPACA